MSTKMRDKVGEATATLDRIGKAPIHIRGKITLIQSAAISKILQEMEIRPHSVGDNVKLRRKILTKAIVAAVSGGRAENCTLEARGLQGGGSKAVGLNKYTAPEEGVLSCVNVVKSKVAEK